RVRAGGAAVDQRARSARRRLEPGPPAAHDRRRRHVPDDRRPDVRRGLPGRGGCRAAGRGSGESRLRRAGNVCLRYRLGARFGALVWARLRGAGGSRENRLVTDKRPRGWRSDRRWQAGFLIGSAIGAAATVIGRRAERIARRGLVDWAQVERLAIRRAERAPGRLTALELQAT